MRFIYLFFIFFTLAITTAAQTFTVKGKLTGADAKAVANATVSLKKTNYNAISDASGNYAIPGVKPGAYVLRTTSIGFKPFTIDIKVIDKDLELNTALEKEVTQIKTIEIQLKKDKTFGVTRLRAIEGTEIYAGKKSEVIVMSDTHANTATNNTRQIYAKITGLNIWESDGAGIQIGIGARGLDPSRTSNFNTRQNGYDMSADALGYPESYYSPPAEAIDRIEVVKGAASLQYGTQFGGLVNFKLNEGSDKKIELISRQTLGSFGFFNTFNSIGGTVGKLKYYTFYQHKSGDGWRPNSDFTVNTSYTSLNYAFNPKFSVTFQYTVMDYLAHQPGGLTDDQFKEDPRQSTRERNWFKVNWNLAALIFDYKLSDRIKLNSRFFGLIASRKALGNLTYINRLDAGGDRDLLDDKYTNWGNETRLLYSYKIKSMNNNLVLGTRFYSGNTRRIQGFGNAGSTGYTGDFQQIKKDSSNNSSYKFPEYNISVFAENIFRITDRFSVVPGVRFENIVTDASGYYTTVYPIFATRAPQFYKQTSYESKSNSRHFVIGGLGLSYYLKAAFQFYANFSQNYKAINFNDIKVVNPNFRVDPNLQDEKGYSADIGSRGEVAGIFNYDVSLFLLNYDNRIGSVVKEDTATHNTYRLRTNVSQSRSIGIETFAELDVWRLIKGEETNTSVSLFNNFSYIDARYINSQESAYRNKYVELAPRVILKSGLTYKYKRFSTSYQFTYNSDQFSDATNAVRTDNAVSGLIPTYYVMDLSAQYEFKKYIMLQVSLNNLTNNYYFTRRAESYPGPGIVPSDGRSAFVTLQFKL